MFNTTNFPGRVDGEPHGGARALFAADRTRRAASTARFASTRAPTNTPTSARARSARSCATTASSSADTWRWKPNLTINAGLRYVLQTPFYPEQQQLLDGDARGRLRCLRRGQPVQAGRAHRQGAGVRPVPGRVSALTTPTGTTSRRTSASRGACLARENGFLGRIFGAEEGDSVLRAGYSVGLQPAGHVRLHRRDRRQPRHPADREPQPDARAISAHPGASSCAIRISSAPPAFPATPIYPLSDVVDEDIHIFDENLQVPWARDVDRRLAAQADQQHGHRSALRRHQRRRPVVGLQLQRNQHRRERLPERVPAGAAEPAGQHRRRPRRHVPLLRCRHRHRAAADLPRLLQRAAGVAGGRCRELHVDAVRQQHVRQPAGALQSAAVRGRQCARRGCCAARQRDPRRSAGELPRRQSGSARRRARSRATAATRATTRCRSSSASGCRTACSSAATTRSARAFVQNFYSLRRPFEYTEDSGGEGGVTHAFKANWVYELPFGRGQRYRQQRQRRARSADRRVELRRHRPHPDRPPDRLRQRAARRHVARRVPATCSSCASTTPAVRCTCCRRTSSTTR